MTKAQATKVQKTRKREAHKFAFIMDPLEHVLVDKDTTFVFMLEAQFRGHEIYFLGLRDLYARGPHVIARARRCEVMRKDPHYKFLDDASSIRSRPSTPSSCARTRPPMRPIFTRRCCSAWPTAIAPSCSIIRPACARPTRSSTR